MSLLGFIVRRIATALALIFVLTAVTFVIWVKIPADPARAFFGPDKQPTTEELAEVNRRLGTDQPLHVQYAKYVWALAHGDFGTSWLNSAFTPDGTLEGAPVRDLIVDALRVTGSLVLGGALVLVLLAIPIGLVAATRQGTILDRLLITFTLVAISTHPIVVGLVLRLFGAQELGLVPPGGYCAMFPDEAERAVPTTTSSLTPLDCGGLRDWAHHLVLPWITFALFLVAIYMRMISTRTIDVLRQPYIKTTRAKGASEWRIVTKHSLRPVLAPVLTMLAMDIGLALGLAIYVESVFGLPGLGRLSVQSIAGLVGYDRPVILGVVIVSGVVIVTLNLVADIAAALLDPRLRESNAWAISMRGAVRSTT